MKQKEGLTCLQTIIWMWVTLFFAGAVAVIALACKGIFLLMNGG